MKIITYNVNGLRAAVSKGLPEWLAKEQPDVLCLQGNQIAAGAVSCGGVGCIGIQALSAFSPEERV